MTTHPVARTGTALLGAAGVLLLAGCSGAAGADADKADPTPTTTDATAPYADGTYTAEGAYQTPEAVEVVSVTMTLSGDVVTAVEVVGEPVAPETKRYQGQFVAGIAEHVVGRHLDELEVDRVAGSSLTSGGFNQALVRIKDEATIGTATNGTATE